METEKRTVQLTLEEYNNMLKAVDRIEVFADFVNASKYSIDREVCGRFLGFEVVANE